MSNIIDVDDNNFESEVLKSDVPVLVDFGASWCGPCQRQLPIIENFANNNVGSVKVCKIDIDDAPAITAKFIIRSVPSLVLFNNGQKIGMKVGLTDSNNLNIFISQNK